MPVFSQRDLPGWIEENKQIEQSKIFREGVSRTAGERLSPRSGKGDGGFSEKCDKPHLCVSNVNEPVDGRRKYTKRQLLLGAMNG